MEEKTHIPYRYTKTVVVRSGDEGNQRKLIRESENVFLSTGEYRRSSALPMEKQGAQARLFWISWLTVSLSFSYLQKKTKFKHNKKNSILPVKKTHKIIPQQTWKEIKNILL